MAYSIIKRGSPYSQNYRVYIQNQNGPISSLHDIPLVVDKRKKIFNMVVTAPRWTNAKMEIAMNETLNPIKQVVENGKPTFIANCFPYHGYIWNLGALPQTCENLDHLDENLMYIGQNVSLDVIEIGYRVAQVGEVLQVKILGILALIDEIITDWKLIAIDVKDPIADQVNDLNDVSNLYPSLLNASLDWFQVYNIAGNIPTNRFANCHGEVKSARFARKIISDVHHFWKGLMNKVVGTEGISCVNTTIEDSLFKISMNEAKDVINKSPVYSQPQKIDSIVDKWHYIDI